MSSSDCGTGQPKVGDSRKALEIDSIVVQSPYLKRFLAEMLDDYPGVCSTLSRLTFDAPFSCFVCMYCTLEGAARLQ